MPNIRKMKGIVYIDGLPGMSREEYEVFRAVRETNGDLSWPPYESVIDVDPEPQADEDPSPSP
tara:strand:+ start:5360 stop:5548 length:189 start_codon:yes stop_codon:yes gene_type:complete